jgi:1-acyl-sn-glycerol-3-phosphate acyltransferase
LSVEGADNIPKRGPFIVAANHASFIDPLVLQMAIPINVSWITKKAVYHNKALWLIHRLCRSIPVNGALDTAITALVDEGRVVGIFPEGTRSKDGLMKQADFGVAILALRSGSPVLPAGIMGSYEAFGPHAVFPKPRRVTVRIGRPFSFERCDSDEIDENVLTHSRDRVMDNIKRLLDDK